jgi:hypothetical protein
MSIPVVEGRRFRLGKYEVVGQPIPHSAHMLRYTVFVDGIRIGALASVPTESDCRFLEHPPLVPALKIYSVIYRPGRPKKGTVRPADKAVAPPALELPHEIELPRDRDIE